VIDYWFANEKGCGEIVKLAHDKSAMIVCPHLFNKRHKEIGIRDVDFENAVKRALFQVDEQSGAQHSILFTPEDVLFTRLASEIVELFDIHLKSDLRLPVGTDTYAPLKEYRFLLTPYQKAIISCVVEHLDSLHNGGDKEAITFQKKRRDPIKAKSPYRNIVHALMSHILENSLPRGEKK